MPATYIVRVFERGSGELIEVLDFDSREQLGIFFANGASFDPDRYYQVSRSA